MLLIILGTFLKKKLSYSFFKTLVLFIIIFLIVSIILIQNLEEIYHKESSLNTNTKIDLKIENIKNNLNSVKDDLFYIKNLYNKNDLNNYEKNLLTFLNTHKEYLKITLIDNNSKQTFNFPNKKITSTNISQEPYYEEILKLKKDDIYLSKIELKKEEDKIVKPYQAITKVITPLYDTENSKIGFLILEYSLNNIFKILEEKEENFKTLFVNKENYIFNSSIEEENFGFMFNKNNTFENLYSKKDERIYFKTKYLEPTKWISSNNSKLKSQTEWKLISFTHKKVIENKIKEYLKSMGWIAALYFIISFFLAIVFAKLKEKEKEDIVRLNISNTAFENSHDGILITDSNNKIIQVNKAFSKITGYDEDEVIGQTPNILSAKGYNTNQFYKNMWENIKKNGTWNGEITNKRKDTTIYTEELSISKIETEDFYTFYIGTFVDISETKKTKKTIEDKVQENKTYLEIMNDYLISVKVDINGKIIDVSDAFCKICQYSKEELLSNNHDIFRHPDTKKDFYVDIWKRIYSGKTWEGELKNKKKNGETYYVHAKISPIYENGSILGYASLAIDITDKKRVEKMSITDEMTQLYNRRYFNTTIEKEISRAKREKKNLGFAILDVDFFKQYNDTYGHKKGDDILINIANTIKNTIHRASDYSFRLGGEEFGILVADIKVENFNDLLNKVRTNVESLKIEHKTSKASSFLTISIGAVIFDPNKSTSKQMYKEADKLLYQVKHQGRNSVLAKKL